MTSGACYAVLLDNPPLVSAVYLNREERRQYLKAVKSAQQQWESMRYIGGNHRLQALALLQPMRRICSGGK